MKTIEQIIADQGFMDYYAQNRPASNPATMGQYNPELIFTVYDQYQNEQLLKRSSVSGDRLPGETEFERRKRLLDEKRRQDRERLALYESVRPSQPTDPPGKQFMIDTVGQAGYESRAARYLEHWHKDRNSYKDEAQPPGPAQPSYPPDPVPQSRPEGRPYGWRKPRETWW